MSTATPAAPAPAAKPNVNRLGVDMTAYKGLPSTLCKGCGHDAITSNLTHSAYDYGVDPYMVAKLSGIGCSSKTTAYLMSQSHGFNAVHGRMAAIATGVNVANRSLTPLGISGDGDTASIGLGQFMHMVRRNVRIVYLIENNGCYGLTKGQFSATADKGSVQKGGKHVNQMDPIDCCALAIEMGCGYVARSFSGDAKQLRALIKGAFAHDGTALIDVVSPCITFNNHEGSTKSYKYAQEHEELLHEVGFVPFYDPITVDYEQGKTMVVELPDKSKITLKKLNRDYDPHNKMQAVELLDKAKQEKLFLTGLIYHNANVQPLVEQEELCDTPLVHLPESKLRPPPQVLEELMNALK
jgi:2-oxoglutarate ferredoxin oxidoreductase subunit beta